MLGRVSRHVGRRKRKLQVPGNGAQWSAKSRRGGYVYYLHEQSDRFSAAIEAVLPQTEIQNCVIHYIRNFIRYLSYKDLKALMARLKVIYAAVDEFSVLEALAVFAQRWDKKYPKISISW